MNQPPDPLKGKPRLKKLRAILAEGEISIDAAAERLFDGPVVDPYDREARRSNTALYIRRLRRAGVEVDVRRQGRKRSFILRQPQVDA